MLITNITHGQSPPTPLSKYIINITWKSGVTEFNVKNTSI